MQRIEYDYCEPIVLEGELHTEERFTIGAIEDAFTAFRHLLAHILKAPARVLQLPEYI